MTGRTWRVLRGVFAAGFVAVAGGTGAAVAASAAPASGAQPSPPAISFQSPVCPAAPVSPQTACPSQNRGVPVIPANLDHLSVLATVSPNNANGPTKIASNPALIVSAGPNTPTPPQPPANACTPNQGSANWTCSWPAPAESAFRYNGVYTLTVTATDCYVVLGSCTGSPASDSATQQFGLALPPAAPAMDAPAVDPSGRSVTLSWSRNTEPDLVAGAAYGIVRDSNALATVAQPASGTMVSWVDSSVLPGQHTYSVLALRYGVTNDPSNTVTSGLSNTVSVVVPVVSATPPTTAGVTAAGGRPSKPGAGGLGGPALVSGKVDLSRFALLAEAARTGKPLAAAEFDSGFQETLPFQAKSGKDGTDSSATEPGPATSLSRIDARTVALVLLLVVLAMHGFVLRNAVRRSNQSAQESPFPD